MRSLLSPVRNEEATGSLSREDCLARSFLFGGVSRLQDMDTALMPNDTKTLKYSYHVKNQLLPAWETHE